MSRSSLIHINPEVVSDNMRQNSNSNSNNPLVTLEDYCKANRSINRPNVNLSKRDNLRIWLQQFDVEIAYDTEIQQISSDLNQIIAELNDIQLLLVDDALFDWEIYRENLEKLIHIREKIHDTQLWIADATCVFDMNTDLTYFKDNTDQLTSVMNKLKERLSDYGEIILYNKDNAHTFDNTIDTLEDIILED